MMRRVIVFLLVIVFLSTAADARTRSKKRGASENESPKSEVAAEKEDSCVAYMVVEGSTGKVLEGENIHKKWPPASIAKLMLAYVVLEKHQRGGVKFSDKITVSADASRMGGSQVFLKEGEVFSLEDLMKAVLVASGNDAAYAVAEFISGSAEACVALMNEKAKALNMVDTEFHSVHGLPPSKGEQEDLTSCSDLAVLARELLKYPKILEWTSIKTESFRDGTFIMNNHNKIMYRMSSVDGLKTGYYRKAGYNVVVTAKKGDLRLIVVVLGSPTARTRDRFAEEKLKQFFSQYTMVTVVKKGDLIDKEIFLPDGKQKSIKGVAGSGFTHPLPHAKKGAIKKELALPEKVGGEIQAGQKLGEMVISLENEIIGKIDIVSPEHVPKAGFFTRVLRKLGLDS